MNASVPAFPEFHNGLLDEPDQRGCRILKRNQHPLWDCSWNYDLYDPKLEFPHNILSTRTVFYSCGMIAKTEDRMMHNHPPGEQRLCQRLAIEATKVMDNVGVGFGNESSNAFEAFYITTVAGSEVPKSLTSAAVRRFFRDTIYPHAEVIVEPVGEQGTIWRDILAYPGEYPLRGRDGSWSPEKEAIEKRELIKRWRTLIEWFQNKKELHGSAFVKIGDDRLPSIDNFACVFPRMVLGITDAGSIVGISGITVNT